MNGETSFWAGPQKGSGRFEREQGQRDLSPLPTRGVRVPSRRRAFTLVEVVASLLILGIMIVGIVMTYI
jgi:prepilin-type N-terminal cleavage/methylation domain-containing protein